MIHRSVHTPDCRRDHVYGVHGRFIAYDCNMRGFETNLSRNELRRGRRKRGPYDLNSVANTICAPQFGYNREYYTNGGNMAEQEQTS